MGKQLRNAHLGFSIDRRCYIILLDEIPGAEPFSIAAEIGSHAVNGSSGKTYTKKTAGSGTNKWEEDATTTYVDAALSAGLADKVSLAGDTMDAGADLVFSGDGEVGGLPSVPLTSSSASSKEYTDSIPGVIQSIVTAIDYGAGGETLILVDSTAQAVDIQLPDVAAYIEKHFHVKWWKGYNDVTMKAQTGQTIDEEDSHIFGERTDSLHVVGVSATEWALV